MNYQEFLDTLCSMVRLNVDSDTTVELKNVIKNNDTSLDALTFQRKDSALSPTIYVNRFYQDYLAGEDPGEIVKTVLSAFEAAKDQEGLDVSVFSDYEKIRDRIMFKLVNYRKNRLLLKDTPHIRYLDLAVVFYCLLAEGEETNATVLLKDHHLSFWKKTLEDIKEDAKRNTPRFLSAEITDMKTMLSSFSVMLEDDTEDAGKQLFVLTNRLKHNGASCLLYQNVLERFSEELRSDLFVLPSSIHEVLLLPAEDRSESDTLSALVREVNRTQLSSEEYLSDHVYYYSRESKQLCL